LPRVCFGKIERVNVDFFFRKDFSRKHLSSRDYLSICVENPAHVVPNTYFVLNAANPLKMNGQPWTGVLRPTVNSIDSERRTAWTWAPGR